MMDFLKKVWAFIKRRWILSSAVGFIIVAIIGFSLTGGGSPYEYFVAERGDLVQVVEVTGRVKAADSVNLAFERGGRVSSVNVSVGDKVFAGNILASLENGDVRADLLSAEATLKAEQAKLDELKKGGRAEEIDIAETKVANAEIALTDARKNLLDKIKDAYIKADDAIRNKVDQMFSNSQSSNPQINVNVEDSQLEIDIEFSRFEIEKLLDKWGEETITLKVDGDLLGAQAEAADVLTEIKEFLDKMALIVNSLRANSGLTQTTIDGYKTDIFTARTNISTADSNLSSALLTLNNEESDLKIAKNELQIKLTGGTEEGIRFQEAKVDAARASVARAQAELLKTLIRAPISGTIGKVDLRKGETVAIGTPLISLVSNNSFQIEVNIAEADIANLEIGQKAITTLDAYSNRDFFNATVVSINPSETIIDGVPTYETTLQFDEEDVRIRPGMTADLDIVTDQKEGVLSVPRRAIIEEGGKKYLRILNANEEVERVEVETGISGREAEIEIISGLKEGDKVVTFIEE